jgi:hypothetical protein
VPLSIQEEMRSQGRPVITQMPPGPTNPLGEFWLALSAHQDIYRISRGDSLAAIRRTLFETDRGESIDWSTARAVLARRDGIAREIGRSARPPQQAEERGQDAGYLPVAPERRQDGRAVSRLIAPPQTPARTSSF